MKRLCLLWISVALLGCGENGEVPVVISENLPDTLATFTAEGYPPDTILNVGLLIMDGVFNTELTAPMDIFQHTKYRSDNYMRVFTIAKTTQPVTSFEGLKIVPDFAYNDSFPHIDILVVPSAEHHLDSDLEDAELLDFVRKTSASAQYVTSHCDGAFVLAKAGVLDGVECTTFPADIGAFREMFPSLKVHETIFVHHGKFITSAGGARSFDAALYLHHLYYGREQTQRTAEGLVLDWKPEEIEMVIVK